MKYNIRYKHFLLGQGESEVLIQSNFDTTLGTDRFCVSSNKKFTDDGDVYGCAAGIGTTEEKALLMCLKELEDYKNSKYQINVKQLSDIKSFELSNLKEINLPCTFCLEIKNKNIYIHFKKNANSLLLLTDKKQIILPYDKNKSLVDNLVLHVKLYKKSKYENFTKEYLIENGFYNEMNPIKSNDKEVHK